MFNGIKMLLQKLSSTLSLFMQLEIMENVFFNKILIFLQI